MHRPNRVRDFAGIGDLPRVTLTSGVGGAEESSTSTDAQLRERSGGGEEGRFILPILLLGFPHLCGWCESVAWLDFYLFLFFFRSSVTIQNLVREVYCLISRLSPQTQVNLRVVGLPTNHIDLS